MRRDVKVRPEMVKGLSVTCESVLAAADEVDDLHTIPVGNRGVPERLAFDDSQIVLDRNTAWIEGKRGEQLDERHALFEVVWFAVEHDLHVLVHSTRLVCQYMLGYRLL